MRYSSILSFFFFFFFQAEDGIRDKLVTGVQTCALPISTPASPRTIPFLSPKLRKCSWAYSTVRDWGNLADQPPIRPHPRSGPASSDLRLDRRAELDRGHEPRGLVQESPGGVQRPRGRPSVGPAHPEVWRPGAAGRGAPGRVPTRGARGCRGAPAG